jgi:hypothetical protein
MAYDFYTRIVWQWTCKCVSRDKRRCALNTAKNLTSSVIQHEPSTLVRSAIEFTVEVTVKVRHLQLKSSVGSDPPHACDERTRTPPM